MFFGKPQNQAPQMQPQPAPQANADVVFDVTTADFEQRVIMVSMETPVIVDFWAPWCGPCKQLGPVLEAAVRAAGGKVVMAKVDIDNNQELAQALRIQSVPTVYAFFQGRPVDGFQGVLPESQIKAFVEKTVQLARAAVPDALNIPQALEAAAQSIMQGQPDVAQSIYMQILEQDEKNAPAYAGMIRTFIAAGQLDHAREMMVNAPAAIATSAVFGEAKSAMELAETKPSGSIDKLAAAVAADENNHQARYDLAQAMFVAGQKEEAMDQLLDIIRRDRAWNDDEARKLLLKYFEALGGADPLTVQGRRKLSSVLFS